MIPHHPEKSANQFAAATWMKPAEAGSPTTRFSGFDLATAANEFAVPLSKGGL
jgi:hypothetical protein